MPFLVGYLTPQDYGAVANGVTDDTVAIQAAITAAQATGKAVFFPATSTSYLLNSVGLTITADDVVLAGETGTGSTLTIGASFTGAAALTITGNNCQVRDLSFFGASTTTTSNPVADAIKISGVRRTKVNRCTFYYINGWAIQAQATSGSSTTNPLGTQIGQIFGNQCAGGIRFLGNTTQAWAMNSSVTDAQFYLTGVASGGSANLDAMRIEDSWDVLVENAILWMTAGTGSAMHIKGNSAASFIKTLDALGPTGAPNVLIDDSANGSPQNTQIMGGVIQQGSVGLQISGGATHVHLNTLRVINNQTHGIAVGGTGTPLYLNDVFFSLNGQGATGTNYEINWSSTATLGAITNCYFSSPIVSTGTAGVQQSINITSGQNVTVINGVFAGTSAGSANWFTNTPGSAIVNNNSRFNFRTRADFAGQIAATPGSAATTAISSNVNGADAFDRYRMLGDGTVQIGPGTATRDVQVTRSAAGTLAQTSLTAGAAAYTVTGANSAGQLLSVTNTTSTPSQANVLWVANAAGDAQLGIAVAADTVNRLAVDSNGVQSYSSGSAAADIATGRAAANAYYVSKNLVVGGTTALGDNGVGELQIKNFTTPPTSAPTGGVVVFAQSGQPLPLMVYDPGGNKRSVVDAVAIATADQSTTSTSQVASTFLTLAVETSATYLMEAGIICTNTTSGNLLFSWTGPTGTTMKWNDTTASLDYTSTIGGLSFAWPSNAGTRLIIYKGKMITSTTSGSLTLTFSNSAGSSVSILTDSWLTLKRVK